MNRICKHCEKEKPIEEFYKKELSRATMCDSCRSDYNKKRNSRKKKLLKYGTKYNA